MRKNRAIFITATDTHVGKTIATFVLGALFQQQGLKVGVIKPVQCAGNDAAWLKKMLGLKDNMSLINPCYAPEPLSPHLAFRRADTCVNVTEIRRAFKKISSQYDVVLVEGAGGLMVPLKEGYYTADLIKDLKADVIIVSRLGLGTINHTLLTINQAKSYGLRIKGILFSDSNSKSKTVAECTNPAEIGRLSKVKILGTIPYLKPVNRKSVLKQCRHLTLD